MSKRRTRKQKIKAQNKYQTFFNPFGSASEAGSDTSVKGYFNEKNLAPSEKKAISNNPAITEQYSNLKLIRKDLIKSLFVSSFILCLIVVLYLTWYK